MARVIIFEGADGCGKSLAVKTAKEFLESMGLTVNVMNITRCTPAGQLFSETYTTSNMGPICQFAGFVYAVSMAKETAILQATKEFDVVILDRGWQSLYAYQIYANQTTIGKAMWEAVSKDGITPHDLTIYIHADPEVALKRVMVGRNKLDKIEQKGVDYQKRVQDGYFELFNKYPHLAPTYVIDNTFSTLDEHKENVVKHIIHLLKGSAK